MKRSALLKFNFTNSKYIYIFIYLINNAENSADSLECKQFSGLDSFIKSASIFQFSFSSTVSRTVTLA